MTPIEPIVEALVCRLDENLREAFEERAGILQFEAGRPRELAEPLALLEVVRSDPLAFAGLVVLQGMREGRSVFVLAPTEREATAALAVLGATGAARVSLPMVLSRLGGAARLTGTA